MVRDAKPAILPDSIISPSDVARLAREIKSIDGFFHAQELRQPGKSTNMPRLSRNMDQFVTENMINLLEAAERQRALELLEYLHASAPIVHMSFSVDPPGIYIQKIVSWMRKNIDGSLLITVGLQPNIGAGCVMRTQNKIFDFSLREYFTEKREHFIKSLHEIVAEEDAPVATQQTVESSTEVAV